MGKPTKIRSAMSAQFNDAYISAWELGADWLTFIGQPMVYDGALFVHRCDYKCETKTPSA